MLSSKNVFLILALSLETLDRPRSLVGGEGKKQQKKNVLKVYSFFFFLEKLL